MSFKAAFSVIEVLLNRPLFQCFDYKLEGLHSDDIVGARVEVNIAGSREIGIVYKVKHDSILPFEKLKNALLLDEKDIFAPDLHKMLSFASNYYLYPLGQCYMSALPKLLRDGKEASYGEIPALAASIPICGSSIIAALLAQWQMGMRIPILLSFSTNQLYFSYCFIVNSLSASSALAK